MDIIYDLEQVGVNIFLFNYNVNSDTPVFTLVVTNPWTEEAKTLTLITDGTDGEWMFTIEGVSNLGYEDLDSGIIYFPNVGTYQTSVSVGVTLIKNINLQII